MSFSYDNPTDDPMYVSEKLAEICDDSVGPKPSPYALRLTDLLRAGLRARPDTWDKSLLHASDLRYGLDQGNLDPGEFSCARQLWMRIRGYEERPTTDGELLMLDNSHELHARLVGAVTGAMAAASGARITFGAEFPVYGIPEIESATVDLHFPVARHVVDFKTLRGKAFNFLRGVKPAHEIQIQGYGLALDALRQTVLYVDREGQNFVREYDVPRNDEGVRQAAKAARAIANAPEMPPPLKRKGKMPWQCEYCRFYGVTCKGAE